jgi:KipI family sensor histidine kinase inhibitor
VKALQPTVALCGNDMAMVDFAPDVHLASPQALAQANQAVRVMMSKIAASPLPNVCDTVAGVASLAVQFSESAQREGWFDEFLEQLRELAQSCVGESAPSGKKVVLSVCFDAELAPDLEEIAQRAGLGKQEVIQRFLASRFAAEVVGFMPGFAYLGGLDPSLAFPRRATPRPAVAAGAVAIAGSQAAVYPSATPGGWNLIGRCPDLLFSINREPPVLIALGDEVQFQEITRMEFDRRWAQRSA